MKIPVFHDDQHGPAIVAAAALLNGLRVVDSTGALELTSIPKRMLVIGGGIIGLEMATVYSALGTRIDVVEMGCDPVDIGKTIHPHPTLGESVGMAAELFEGVCTDLPPQKK